MLDAVLSQIRWARKVCSQHRLCDLAQPWFTITTRGTHTHTSAQCRQRKFRRTLTVANMFQFVSNTITIQTIKS
jgi:hypothetical protein